MIEKLYTIGVYGSTEETFFQALIDAEIDLFCDIRQRRGLRGKTYAYANSVYLQERLQVLGIAYLHEKALAPTASVREQQKLADTESGTAKRQREVLGDAFTQTYHEEILQPYNMTDFIKKVDEYHNICFFCVERLPEACHRSLVALRLKELLNIQLIHLVP